MSRTLDSHLRGLLSQIEHDGLTKRERVIHSAQSAQIEVGGRTVLNFCANNYLGLADSEDLREAALKCLPIPREACRARALEFSWKASAEAYARNLEPAGKRGAEK